MTKDLQERLNFLVRVVNKEIRHLEYIDSPLILSNAIAEAGRYQPQLVSFATALFDDACKRGMIDPQVG